MTSDYGIFSLSIESVKWQIKNLFDEVGGDDAIRTLDELSSLPKGVQTNLLLAFERIIKEVKSGSLQLQSGAETEQDIAKKEFEANLLSGIQQDISRDTSRDISQAKFSVIDGGKLVTKNSKIINFPEQKRPELRTAIKLDSDDKLIA